MTDPRLDPVSVVQVLAAMLVGAGPAAYLGPYAVIAAGGAAGAFIALSRRPPERSLHAAAFVTVMTLMALLLTVSAAEVLRHYTSLEIRWTLAPLAMLIGGVGYDWPAVGSWIVSAARRVFERRAGIDGGAANGGS